MCPYFTVITIVILIIVTVIIVTVIIVIVTVIIVSIVIVTVATVIIVVTVVIATVIIVIVIIVTVIIVIVIIMDGLMQPLSAFCDQGGEKGAKSKKLHGAVEVRNPSGGTHTLSWEPDGGEAAFFLNFCWHPRIFF